MTFSVNIVNIGDISNIYDYTNDFIYSQMNGHLILIPIYTFEELMGNDNDTTITDLHTYHIAYNVAAKQMTLAIAHHINNKGKSMK